EGVAGGAARRPRRRRQRHPGVGHRREERPERGREPRGRLRPADEQVDDRGPAPDPARGRRRRRRERHRVRVRRVRRAGPARHDQPQGGHGDHRHRPARAGRRLRPRSGRAEPLPRRHPPRPPPRPPRRGHRRRLRRARPSRGAPPRRSPRGRPPRPRVGRHRRLRAAARGGALRRPRRGGRAAGHPPPHARAVAPMRLPLRLGTPLLIGLLLAGTAAAQPSPDTDPDGVVAAVEAAYEQLDYETAEALAREALTHYEAFTPDQLVRLHTLLGLILYARGEELEAAAQFRAALTLDPTLTLDPLLVSPTTIAFFERTKEAFLQEQSAGGSPGGGVRYVTVYDP